MYRSIGCYIYEVEIDEGKNTIQELIANLRGDQLYIFPFILSTDIIHDQVNVSFASSSIARKTMVEMLYVAPCSINGFFLAQFILLFLAPQCIPCSKQ